ncbi:MAG: hypothetical protein RLZZ516_2330 [Cyanobacteriota bacterium]|jgi:hypothetical protein
MTAPPTDTRIAFGRMLLNWRKRNGFTQYTVCNWAKEADFDAISYGNLSVIEQGKAGELRQKAFFQLAEMNRRIAEHDWGPVKDPVIRARLEEARPIGDDACPVWGALELWACYTGMREVPEAYRSAPIAETLRDKLIRCGWVTEFNADTLVRLIESHYADEQRARRRVRAVKPPAGGETEACQ